MIILQGGEDVRKRANEALFQDVAAISAKKRILIIPWTQESDDKEMEYLHLFREYFSDSGFQSTDFLNILNAKNAETVVIESAKTMTVLANFAIVAVV